ncbi:MAG TPA: MlaD family protein [Gemmatimonadaceae bacterium]|jgi:phospholipid/cholesterol/gamma-HCH transport system substrate-binding protein|nr:MlaD family protein [Gemmatimonadaceae bacterium]
MRRSTGVTWDQLKVGAVILVALVVIAVAILKLGQAAHLFTSRYTLVSFVPNTAGLRVGGQVTVAGQLAGSVKSIEFLPVDADTLKNLKILIEVDKEVQPQVRRDSQAKLKTLGLLGDKVFDISPGTPRYTMLQEGDTLSLGNAIDYEQVLAQASGALDQVVTLTGSLQKVANGVVQGQGTVGQLLTNRQLFDNLNSTLATTNTLMARLQNPRGTVGQLLNDPALYNNLNRVLASADTLVGSLGSGINSETGTVGKLLRDDQLYTRLLSAVSGMDSIVTTMQQGNGTMKKLFTDEQLYTQLLQSVTNLNQVLTDVRGNPSRYTRGLIRVF